MKIKSVIHNNRKRVFEVKTARGTLLYPYSRSDPTPSKTELVSRTFLDRDLGREGFTYTLSSGKEGAVHVEQILEYNQDPTHMRNALLYQLTLEAQKRLVATALSKREIIRRLGTSATQFYRLIDQTNYRKTIDQLLSLLRILDCDVDLVVRKKNHSAPIARSATTAPG